MNIYFLVEGQSTEADVYPAWISYLIPELTRVEFFDEVAHNHYYLFSSSGIPYIENDIVNAIMDINALGKYQYLIICLDADAATVPQREEKIFSWLKTKNIALMDGASLEIIVQNRCIETWFLGNRKVYSRNPHKNLSFIRYANFYNVAQNDPELMGKIEDFNGSVANFHFSYLKAMFNEKGNMIYSKSNSYEVQRESYLTELINRVNDHSTHLKSFNKFLKLCHNIRLEINR